MTTLATGARLGPYAVLDPVGAGGMGEVYRATDTRLDRIVAIKILPAHVADSPMRRQRFEREARAVSSLNDPHICSLYDVGEQDGLPFLVMEFVEGETLALRLMRGALPIDQALRHAIDIADALDHAHRQGIVHRDLKPANIMLTRAGVKLLDFGVAKLWAPDSGAGRSFAAPRPMETITEEGTIVGTLHYMAPEQLAGQSTDARADIFAFGAIVYEMVTGRQAFEADSQAGVMAAILTQAPRAPAGGAMPPLLDHVISRCVAKDPDDRWQTASDLKRELKWIADSGAQVAVAGTSAEPRSRRREWLAWIAAAILFIVASAATAALRLAWRAPAAPLPVQFLIPPPENGAFNQSSAFMAVSPDGRYLAFVASSREGNPTLWVRPLDSPMARQLPGTENIFQPFWSPDSKSIAFAAGNKLKKIDVASGLPQTVADTPAGGGTWNRDGIIVFQRSAGPGDSLYQVSASGGPVVPVTTLDKARGEIRHSWPQFLPDGRHFIYLVKSAQPEDDGAVYVSSLDSTDRVRLLNADSHAAYAPPGYLLFVRGSTLLAQPFDAGTARLAGEPKPIADQVERTPGSYRGAFSASETGLLAYRRIAETELVWFDPSGRPLDSIGPPARYSNPTLSPDEQRVAVGRQDPETGTTGIWLIELSRRGASRFGPSPAVMPLWSPDGSRIVFRGSGGFYQKASSGNGDAELLVATIGAFGNPLGWTHDGSALIYQTGTPLELWMLPLSGDRSPRAWHNTDFSEAQGQLSPDGRWMAYISDESRKNEVYVRSFPSGEGKRQVSIDGGIEPTWRRDGKELFYLAPDQNLMSVAVTTGSIFDAASPVPLFKTRMSTLVNPGYTRNQYVVAADGQRILVNQTRAGAPSSPISVVLNWTATLKK